jgi:hypothetical protein
MWARIFIQLFVVTLDHSSPVVARHGLACCRGRFSFRRLAFWHTDPVLQFGVSFRGILAISVELGIKILLDIGRKGFSVDFLES